MIFKKIKHLSLLLSEVFYLKFKDQRALQFRVISKSYLFSEGGDEVTHSLASFRLT